MRSPPEGGSAAATTGADLAIFLRLLFAGYGAGLIEVAHGRRAADGRLLLGSRRRPGDYVPVATPDHAAARAARAVAAGEEVFLGVLPRQAPRPRREEVPEARCVWLDLDSEEAFARARAHHLPPHLVVASGSGGGHCYWLLADAVAPEAAEDANRRLAAHLGADPASCDRLRVLRAPGSPNRKAGRCARLLAARPASAPCALGVLLAEVPERARPAARPLPTLLSAPETDPLRQIAPRVWFLRLTGAAPDAAGYARCPLHDDRVPSLKLYERPERGWCCFAGCGSGSVYDFGALLFGLSTRGPEFHELRRRLRDALGV